jgi:hypothetical protein
MVVGGVRVQITNLGRIRLIFIEQLTQFPSTDNYNFYIYFTHKKHSKISEPTTYRHYKYINTFPILVIQLGRIKIAHYK